MNTRHDGIQQRQRADEQGPPPTPVSGVRNHEISDACGHDPTHSPEGFQQHGHTSALLGRRELGDERRRDRQFGAQPQSDNQSGDEQCGQRPRQCHTTVGQTENHQCCREDRLASHTIGDVSAECRSDGHADEAYGQHPAFLRRRQIEMRVGRDGRDHERHQTDVHGIERPSDAGSHQQLAVGFIERQPVKSLVSGKFDRSPSGLLRCGHLFPSCFSHFFERDTSRRGQNGKRIIL